MSYVAVARATALVGLLLDDKLEQPIAIDGRWSRGH